jgi:hypothetical protein
MVQWPEEESRFSELTAGDPTPRSSPALRFVHCGTRITAGGKRFRARDELGALFLPSPRTHLPATWPSDHRRGGRRSPWLRHAMVLSPRNRNYGKPRITILESLCRWAPRQIAPVTRSLLTASSSPSKFVVLAVALYKLSAQRAPLDCYAPSEPTLASNRSP